MWRRKTKAKGEIISQTKHPADRLPGAATLGFTSSLSFDDPAKLLLLDDLLRAVFPGLSNFIVAASPQSHI